MTTILTVGYGDISAINEYEKIFVIFLMLIGVMFVSYSTGTLSSIIANFDSEEAKAK